MIDTGHGRVGVISVTYGFNTGPPEQPWQVSTLDVDAVLATARAARAVGADLVVVAVHAGTEYDTEPNSEQRAAAEALLASPDVDLVYGHHAHVVQPLQQINGKWVIYGLGNALRRMPPRSTPPGKVCWSGSPSARTARAAGRPVTSPGCASLQGPGPPHRWCPLTAGNSCADPALDAAVLTRTTEIVNRYGAATAGAHPLDPP